MLTSRPKTFPTTSPNGLGIAKNGKLQYPFIFVAGPNPDPTNNYGQPYPAIGDYVAYAIPSGILSAGTVGIIRGTDPRFSHIHDGAYTVEMLDGSKDTCYRYGCGVLTVGQVKEVIAHYVSAGKPGRIRAPWAMAL